MTAPATTAPGGPCPHCRAGALVCLPHAPDPAPGFPRVLYCPRCDSYHDDDSHPIRYPADAWGEPIEGW